MLKRTVLGFAAIAASTSCVPPPMRVAAPLTDVPVRDAAEARSLLAGLALEGLRPLVRDGFVGVSTCTHLNDTMRSIEDVRALLLDLR